MRTLLSFGVISLLAVYSGRLCSAADQPAPATKQTVTTKQVAPKPAAAKSTYLKPGAIKPAQLTATKQGAKKAPPRPSYYGQMQPTPERYKEIQQALVDKGYFSGTPDGVWGATSGEALKRFQHDQNLSEDGKVDALSLIALGLGPKRASGPVDPPATK